MKRLLVILIVAALLGGGCGGRRNRGGDAAAKVGERCQALAPDVVRTLASRLTVDGDRPLMRNGYAVQAKDGSRWFISAELVRDRDAESQAGEILTWVGDDPATTAPIAVDENARRFTDWPDAADDVSIRDEGAIESRACVNGPRP